jgi:RHS repeat-associated protein
LTRVIAYDEEHRVVSIQDGGSQVEARTYYLANDQKIAQRIIQGGSDTLSYVHADHLGSSVKLTDETGQVIQTIAYDPYGETALSEGATEPAYQYTGQEKDAETGLYYYGARYYDPELGRFIQGDSLLDGLNRYAYGHNNPLKYTDPTGNYVVDPDTNECFGGDCDHYPGYEDYDPATGDEDNDGDDTDDDWALYRQVINNILGESWEIKGVSDIFLYDFSNSRFDNAGVSTASRQMRMAFSRPAPASGDASRLDQKPKRELLPPVKHQKSLALFGRDFFAKYKRC